jgi:hypothetical protein
MFDWWRSWHGAPTDDKWLVIAKRAGVPAIIVPAIAWALLDHASQAPERGDVSTFDIEAYALKFGIDEKQISAVISAMEARTMIVSGRIAQWDKRQKNDSTERSRKSRGKAPAPELPLDAPAAENDAPAAEASPRENVDSVQPEPPASADPERGAITPQAMALADEIAVIAGHDLQFIPPEWCGAPARVQMWFNQGWSAPFVLQSVKAQMHRKRDGPPRSIQYFERGIADAMARSEAPLPKVVPFAEARQARHDKQQPRTIANAADRLIAEIESRSGASGEDASRLLPQR